MSVTFPHDHAAAEAEIERLKMRVAAQLDEALGDSVDDIEFSLLVDSAVEGLLSRLDAA